MVHIKSKLRKILSTKGRNWLDSNFIVGPTNGFVAFFLIETIKKFAFLWVPNLGLYFIVHLDGPYGGPIRWGAHDNMRTDVGVGYMNFISPCLSILFLSKTLSKPLK